LQQVQTAPESILHEVPRLIASIDPAKPETLYGAEQITKLGRDASAELINLIDSDDIVDRWVAIYYFSRLAEQDDLEELSKGLTDSNISLRTIVAATLLRLGDNSGLSVLQDALASDEVMIFSEPPILLADYASSSLSAYRPKPVSFLKNEPYPPELPFDIDIRVNDCTVEVGLNLQFIGPGATQALANSWASAITQMWDGRTTSGGCNLHLTVEVKDYSYLHPRRGITHIKRNSR
jgi:hypothetical protein